MKIKLTYFFMLCNVLLSHSQLQKFELEKGHCVLFRNSIYAYGFRPGALCIYKLNAGLNALDSAFYVFPDKSKSVDYLSIDVDTLHQTLNFCLQKRDKLKATLLRFDTRLKLINEFKNMDVTKLNPLANYDQQKFVYKNFCYVVKSVSDTAGKHYYLSKFEFMLSVEKPFDYQFKWQFNFDKKFIRNVNIFYADTSCVLSYVDIHSGDRKGQWLLKINASDGVIIKAKKINGNPGLNYRYSNFVADPRTKDVFVTGQLTAGEQLATATPTLFILQFDSLLNLTNQELITERVSPANPKAKLLSAYIFQISHVNIKPNSTYELSIDLYKNKGTEFNYCNSFTQQFSVEDGEITVAPVLLKEYQEIENYYFTTDKKDLNGKLFQDSTNSDRLFYTAPVFPVKLGYKLNDREMPMWLLKKNDIKTRSLNYSVLQPGLKVYELKTIQALNKDEDPNLILLNKSTYLIYYTKNNSAFHLELGNW